MIYYFLLCFLVCPFGFAQDTIMKRLNETQMTVCENCVSTPQFFVVAPGITRDNDRFYCLPFPPVRDFIARHYILHVQDCSVPYVEDLYASSEMKHYKREWQGSFLLQTR